MKDNILHHNQGAGSPAGEIPVGDSGVSGGKGRLTLRKWGRLHHHTLVDRLFSEGKNLYDPPLRLTWKAYGAEETESLFKHGVPEGIGPLQMMVTVPKKKRRRAVDRVRMRRLIREAYRLNCRELLAQVSERPDLRTVSLAFIYLDGHNAEWDEIEPKMRSLLKRLSKKLASR